MQDEILNDDEFDIDLHNIIHLLWKSRKLIIGLTLGSALLAFFISNWVFPRQYLANAFVFIGQPIMSIKPESSITYSPNLPDIKAVVDLSTTPEILDNVLRDPGIIAALGRDSLNISGLAKKVTVSDVGKDQLSLKITDSDPDRAVLLTNTLARQIASKVNSTYGLTSIADILDSQIAMAQKDYNQAQGALEDALAKSQVDTLKAKKDGKTTELSDLLFINRKISSVLNDLDTFDEGISGFSLETPLPVSEGLVLITLRQNSLASSLMADRQKVNITTETGASTPVIELGTSSQNLTAALQVNVSSVDSLTVGQALQSTKQLRQALEKQQQRLQNAQSQIEQDLPLLEKELEKAQSEIDQLSNIRDQASELYNNLSQQHQMISTVLAESANVATVSITAVRPDEAFAPKVYLITAVAAIAGLVLALFIAYLINWWNTEAEMKSALGKNS